MDQQVFEAGKLAYQQGDWATAAAQLQASKTPGEVNGGIDHLLGNALMKLGRYPEAATAYEQALRDASYGKVGALSCNRGNHWIIENNTILNSNAVAIDIGGDYKTYWSWTKPGAKETDKVTYQNKMPHEIVEIFEKHGFIWGGRWYHYDTMHFEYRPEILLMEKKRASN